MEEEIITISNDKDRLDVSFIHSITSSLWPNGRTIGELKSCIDNSLNFGVYLNAKQIGYARVVTDYTRFAYLLDVFIDTPYQKRGYSRKLMEYIMAHPCLRGIKHWELSTTSAHYLYEKFGFKVISYPERHMSKISWDEK